MKKNWVAPGAEDLNVEETAFFIKQSNKDDGVFAGQTHPTTGKEAPLDGFECEISCS